MAQTATYRCEALVGTNKAGVIKCDPDGYYNMILGALDYYNSAGAFYPFNTAKKLFDSSSNLMRRISKGVLKGECGHPRMAPGMNKRDFLMRVLDIDEKTVSHHIKEVTIDDTVKDLKGNNVIAIMGRIKPTGPMADALALSLENPSENTCFSIRSLTDDVIDTQGRYVKNLVEIITWDWVNEPGLAIASKYNNPALENRELERVTFTKEHFSLAKHHLTENGFSLENDNVARIDAAMKAYGWDVQKSTPTSSGLLLPASARW